ncbi:hypothetical protein BC939DRAFT_385445, partial [Gamsiella multidivaricata]|uniref:uncharacterized protein n=1 Tax=Gamsiella multidivaricata TaxID=101098 RepID=UPI00221E7C31
YIPVFFLLTQSFGTHDYGSPHRNVEKGLLLLYALMKTPSLIHKLDCIVLDGGYNGFVGQIVDASEELSHGNFSYPVRKTRGIALTDIETQYNKAFGGFRSKIESCFADLQSTFAKFTHNAPVRFADEKTFELQFKLCCLLMNIKKAVASQNIAIQPHHGFWMQDGFDF